MQDYKELVEAVIEENRETLLDVDMDEIKKLLDAIAGADKIMVFGMGRMKCAVRAFTMRLMHMGLDAHVVYDTACPNIGKGDILIMMLMGKLNITPAQMARRHTNVDGYMSIDG
jgi:6-phospho-3-hexuloisomerase